MLIVGALGCGKTNLLFIKIMVARKLATERLERAKQEHLEAMEKYIIKLGILDKFSELGIATSKANSDNDTIVEFNPVYKSKSKIQFNHHPSFQTTLDC